MSKRVVPSSVRDHVRGVRPTDLTRLREIEAKSFQVPWSSADWDRVWRAPTTKGFVATAAPPTFKDESGGLVLGYCIADFGRRGTEILNLAVVPHARRRGLGRALVRECLDISYLRGVPTRVVTHDACLDSHKFFRACGFLAVAVQKGVFFDGDGYWFVSGGE